MGLNTGIQRAVDFLANYYRGELALEQSEEAKRLKAEAAAAKKAGDIQRANYYTAKLAELAGKEEQDRAAGQQYTDITGEVPPAVKKVRDEILGKLTERGLQKKGFLPAAPQKQPITVSQLKNLALRKYEVTLNAKRAIVEREGSSLWPDIFLEENPVTGTQRVRMPTNAEVKPKMDSLYFKDPDAWRRWNRVWEDYRGALENPDSVLTDIERHIRLDANLAPHEVLPDAPAESETSELAVPGEALLKQLMDGLSDFDEEDEEE